MDPDRINLPERRELVAHWLRLTRDILPKMAAAEGWPIRADHCFMRVFLDHAMSGRWDATVCRPAIRHMDRADLARAVALAEAVVAAPARLPGLNQQSLAWRQRRAAPPGLAAGG
jgi:hypothetical protein